jgi:hypothetical protein
MASASMAGKTVYMPETYKETNRYIDTQPLDKRKNGFGSKDAFKSDEFANFVRTEQYRETIKRERPSKNQESTMREALEKLLAAKDAERSVMMGASGSDPMTRTMNYDIGRTLENEFNPKGKRDTYYTFNDEKGRTFAGGNVPMSCAYGGDAWNTEYKPPSKS